MTTISERAKYIERLASRIDPTLREFIDRAIIPALVSEYRELGDKIAVAEADGDDSNSSLSTAASTRKGEVRP